MRPALTLTLLFLGAACATAPLELNRAFIEPAMVERAIAHEKELAAQYDTAGEPWFTTREGNGRVLIVAGHATSQTREGKRKGPDSGTGSLALLVAELTDSPAIWTTRMSPSDPNYYDDNAFKAELARMIERHRPILVLDLHASHWLRPYDVDFGTMNGTSLPGRERWLRELAVILRDEGLHNLSRDYFAAAKNQTVTKFAAARGIPAMQLEISSTWLHPETGYLDGHRFAQLTQALVRFVRKVDGPRPHGTNGTNGTNRTNGTNEKSHPSYLSHPSYSSHPPQLTP